jgi:ATP synthase protein I
MADYRRMQRRLLLFSAGLSTAGVIVALLSFSRPTALSVAIGALSGVVYLLLLSRSVEKIGSNNKQVGKVQLLVPVALVMLSTRWHLLQLVPALIGFLLYKPAVIISTALDLWIGRSPQGSPPTSTNA